MKFLCGQNNFMNKHGFELILQTFQAVELLEPSFQTTPKYSKLNSNLCSKIPCQIYHTLLNNAKKEGIQ